MGFKIKKELIKDDNGFRPIDLNEENVNVIFKRCLLNEDNRHNQTSTRSFLFLKELGYDVSKDKIYFDKNTIIANKKNIEYLFGQLQPVHNSKKTSVSIEDFCKKYTNENWTANKAVLLELLFLGACDDVDLIAPFNPKNDTTGFITHIKPTLSPNDSKFPEWWKEHKSEWEDRKKGGIEPSDD